MDRLTRCLSEFSCCLCYRLFLVAFLVPLADFSEHVSLWSFQVKSFKGLDCYELRSQKDYVFVVGGFFAMVQSLR